MYIRVKENQERHDVSVAQLAAILIGKGWSNVLSDLPGKTKPPIIGDYVPDIYGQSGIREIVVEVETEDSKDTDHSKAQLATFQIWQKASPTTRQFVQRVV